MNERDGHIYNNQRNKQTKKGEIKKKEREGVKG